MNYIKILILIFFLISNISARDHMFPFDIKNIEKIYKLSNGNIVFIEQYERGDRIWELDKGTGNVNQLSFVWSFIALAQKCEHIKGEDIYFASNLEYWFAGGSKIDNPEIRIFNLKNKSPWRNTDLGITPSINYAKEFCNFYEQIQKDKFFGK